jgi:predicted dehydrogenase
MQEIRAGVIGLGAGERHVAGYARIPGVRVAAVSDPDPVRLRTVCDAHGVDQAYADWRDLLDDPAIDLVSVCSHDDTHVAQAIAAFEAGKHVMMERPSALYREEAERLLRAQQDSGKRISANTVLRENPRFKEIRRLAREGAFGDLFYLEADYLHQTLWRDGQGLRGRMDFFGVTYGGGIHLIDLMRWILGAEVKRIDGEGTRIKNRSQSMAHPDALTHVLGFDNAVTAKATTAFGSERGQMSRLNLFGSRMTFESDRRVGVGYHSDDPAAAPDIAEAPYRGMEEGDILPDFIRAVREDREPEVGATDVFRAMDVCLACWQAADQRRPVDVAYMM